jgi:1-acyl-sn-glycerol-3-phosphate acyltransferase
MTRPPVQQTSWKEHSLSSSAAPQTPRLNRRERLALQVQRFAGRLLAPVWVPAVAALMRFGMGWRIEGLAAARRRYRALWRAGDGPVVVCANHLTMIDSALIAWALGSPAWFLTHYPMLPWNVPERRNFAASRISRLLVYLMKCIPVTRGGARDDVAGVLNRLVYLLAHGEAVLIFPEGGRSRSGRVEVDNTTYGVGQLLDALPGCRVLCVYLRGARQNGFGDVPPRGERFQIRLDCLQPTSALTGLRRARDLSQQIVRALSRLEEEYFNDRQ